jgi:hypothetical protein
MKAMSAEVRRVVPDDDVWPSVAGPFPQAVRWLGDATDEGDYCFFAGTDDRKVFLGGSVVDISPLQFGPLADTPA